MLLHLILPNRNRHLIETIGQAEISHEKLGRVDNKTRPSVVKREN